MKSRDLPREPRRLVDEGGRSATLLRAADDEYREHLDEPGAFRRIEGRRRERRARVAGLGGGLALIATGLALHLGSKTPAENAAELLTAEPVPARSAPPKSQSSASPNHVLVESRKVTEPRPSSLEAPEPLVAKAPERPSAQRLAQPPRPAEPARAEAMPAARDTCRDLSSAKGLGGNERLICLRDLSAGNGLTAEAALYELARSTALHSGRREEALALLATHGARFPASALRGEVDELEVRLLYELGRDREALAKSEATLAAPWGRVISSELHLLRGIIYEERLRDCGSAVTEYVALVGDPGPRADDAEFRRARCLERLGRREDAASAFERYLGRPAPKHAEAARARLSALGGAPEMPGETLARPSGRETSPSPPGGSGNSPD